MVKKKTGKEDVTRILSSHKNLRSGRLKPMNSKHHTVYVKDGTCHIGQQLYRAGQQSQEVVCEHIDQQLEADVIKPAQSK